MDTNIKPGTIWGVGRNYIDHANEMNAPIPTEPLIFLKSGNCLVENSHFINIPALTHNLHYEVEIIVQLNVNLEPYRMALALDLTARDKQEEAKANGTPWSLAKSFKNSCPVSAWTSFENYDWFSSLEFHLTLNGEIKQAGNTKDMIFSLEKLLYYLKLNFPVQPGDMILTGTPAGVGQLNRSDFVEVQMTNYIDWQWQID